MSSPPTQPDTTPTQSDFTPTQAGFTSEQAKFTSTRADDKFTQADTTPTAGDSYLLISEADKTGKRNTRKHYLKPNEAYRGGTNPKWKLGSFVTHAPPSLASPSVESAWKINPEAEENETFQPIAAKYSLHTPSWTRALKTPSAFSEFAFVTDAETNVTGVERTLNPPSSFHQHMTDLKAEKARKAKKALETHMEKLCQAAAASNKGNGSTFSSKATQP